MSKKGPIKWDFRDVSSGLQKFREFLLGRKYIFHNRFPPLISPRSIPPPDIPRGPEYKYSDQWYNKRNALGSVAPPVIAPIAEGIKPCKPPASKGKTKYAPKSKEPCVEFPCPPTPGLAWWFDGHCYYKLTEICKTAPPPPPCPPTCPPPPPPPPKLAKKKKKRQPCPKPKDDPCKEEPPCKLEPCKVVVKEPPPPPPPVCDPCKPPDPCAKPDEDKKKCK